MVPSAPLMSPIWASSSTAVRRVGGTLSSSIVSMADMLLSFKGMARSAYKGVAFSVAGRLRELFCQPEPLCARLHLQPDITWFDPGAVPKNNEVIEKIRALAYGAFGAVPHRFNGDFAGFLDQLLRDLAVAGVKKSEGAGVDGLSRFAKRLIESLQFSGSCRAGRRCERGTLMVLRGSSCGSKRQPCRNRGSCLCTSCTAGSVDSAQTRARKHDFGHGSPFCCVSTAKGEPRTLRVPVTPSNADHGRLMFSCVPPKGSRGGGEATTSGTTRSVVHVHLDRLRAAGQVTSRL